jgi:hypothetical protein
MGKKLKAWDSFDVDDIHRIREENYEKVKDMSREERVKCYSDRGERARLRLEALYEESRQAI